MSFKGLSSALRGTCKALTWRFSRPSSIVLPIHEGVDESFNLAGSALSKPISAKSELVKYTLPPIIFGSALYISSFIKSFSDTKEKNKNLIQYYADDRIALIPPRLFMDFEEPSVINNY